MGHNPSRNPFKVARETSPARLADDSYVALSRWRTFRKLDASIRTRYFGPDELAWLSRYGTRLDRLATLAAEPRNDREKHFVRVCLGHEEPTSPRERLWLLMQVMCRYEEAAERAARTDVLEEEAGVCSRGQGEGQSPRGVRAATVVGTASRHLLSATSAAGHLQC